MHICICDVCLTQTFGLFTYEYLQSAISVHCDSIITRSPHGSHIFLQYNMCENVSKRSRYTQYKLPVFPSQVFHQLIFPVAVSTGHMIYTQSILFIPRSFVDIFCITIKLNTLIDVPYQMTVGGAFVYVSENRGNRSH